MRLKLFLVLTASAIAIFVSSKPWTACSVIIRFNTALNNPPCRSTLPICSGLSTPAWRIRTPCWASVRAKTPRLWTPRLQLKVCGQPAQPTHKLTKLSKHSQLDGELCPCRSSTTCWKLVPKSRMFKHRQGSSVMSLTSRTSMPRFRPKALSFGSATLVD